jgi:hypothetical protein
MVNRIKFGINKAFHPTLGSKHKNCDSTPRSYKLVIKKEVKKL